MTQAIQARNGAESLALWTEADVAHVRATVAPNANEQEFRLLVYMANKYQLDPLLKEIWCVKYGTKPAQIFAGRDGFLAIAHRTGAFDGLECPIRTEQVPLSITYWDNNAKQNATFARAYQYVATARAYNKSTSHPVTVEVWEEEYSTGQNLWVTKPRTMLAKVAECQALRKAFRIAGLYDPAEMMNPDTGEILTVPARALQPPDPDFDAEERAAAEYAAAQEAQAAPFRYQPDQRPAISDASAAPAVQEVREATATAAPEREFVDPLRAAWADFRYVAPMLGYTTEDGQLAYLRSQHPGRKIKELTVGEVRAQTAALRALLPAPEAIPV